MRMVVIATAFLVLTGGPMVARPLPVPRGSQAAQMARDYQALTSEEMMRRYFPCEGDVRSDVGTLLVEAGLPIAIAVAVKLHGATGSACGNEEITSALSNATKTNPEAVLRYARPELYDGRLICGPDIVEGINLKTANALLRQAQRALQRVHVPSLVGARDKCLAEYPRYFANVRKSFGR